MYEGEEANDLEEGWVEYDIEAMLEELGYKDASDMMYSITDVNIVAPKETSKECKNPHNYRVESGDLTKVFDTETDKCVSLLDDGRLYVTLLSSIEIVGMLESLRAD